MTLTALKEWPENATVIRPAGLPDIEVLRASYRRQTFVPHAHEGYLIGTIEHGVHAVTCRGVKHYATGGTLATMNPGEVHDGGGGNGDGWTQRMVYVPEEALVELLRDHLDRDAVVTPAFTDCFRLDPVFASTFARLHDALADREPLIRQSAFADLSVSTVQRHAVLTEPTPRAASPAAITRARDYLRTHAVRPVPLNELAAVVGLRRRHLIELFKRTYGLPPHRYLLGLRIASAKRLLVQGIPPAEVAVAVGFADQSHLTRHFRAVVGTTPGRYARHNQRPFVL